MDMEEGKALYWFVGQDLELSIVPIHFHRHYGPDGLQLLIFLVVDAHAHLVDAFGIGVMRGEIHPLVQIRDGGKVEPSSSHHKHGHLEISGRVLGKGEEG